MTSQALPPKRTVRVYMKGRSDSLHFTWAGIDFLCFFFNKYSSSVGFSSARKHYAAQSGMGDENTFERAAPLNVCSFSLRK